MTQYSIDFIASVNSQQGEKALLDLLRQKLSDKQTVLWIVAGGSNIPIEVRVLNQLTDNQTAYLNIILGDERYGPSGHIDSNYQQLIMAGLMPRKATFVNILADNPSPQEALNRYRQLYDDMLHASDFVVGQLGIGKDGHIAGILPASPAASERYNIILYKGQDFQRLSLTFKGLSFIDCALIFCFGADKKLALQRLKVSREDKNQLPSLILRQLPDVKVYNDQLG